MIGYKTMVCSVCGKIHDNAANCPPQYALCEECKENRVRQSLRE